MKKNKECSHNFGTVARFLSSLEWWVRYICLFVFHVLTYGTGCYVASLISAYATEQFRLMCFFSEVYISVGNGTRKEKKYILYTVDYI